jgi:LmbE family N-acetylglucosaminyl deacetylase
MPAAELAAVRAGEGAAAARALGVAEADLAFLGFPDGRLAAHGDAARERVLEVLARRRPRQVFLPYPRGEHPDHVATHAIVKTALARLPAAPQVLEYPIWFWRHWPWVAVAGDDARDVARASFDAAFGLRLFLEEQREELAGAGRRQRRRVPRAVPPGSGNFSGVVTLL